MIYKNHDNSNGNINDTGSEDSNDDSNDDNNNGNSRLIMILLHQEKSIEEEKRTLFDGTFAREARRHLFLSLFYLQTLCTVQ